ncbi:integrase core domain-containing protein [Nitrospirota bacterium]
MRMCTCKGYEKITDVRIGLKKYFEYYNGKRRHQGLDRKTPDTVYWSTLVEKQAAA